MVLDISNKKDLIKNVDYIRDNNIYIRELRVDDNKLIISFIDGEHRDIENYSELIKKLEQYHYVELINTIKTSRSKGRIMMKLIDFIGIYTVYKVYTLKNEEMPRDYIYKYYDSKINMDKAVNCVEELMGCYCNSQYSYFWMYELGCLGVKEEVLKEMGKKSIILICEDNVVEFSDKFVSTFNIEHKTYYKHQKKKLNINNIYNIILELVLLHEYGHAVHAYNHEKGEFGEKQANYYASISTYGYYDDLISKISSLQSINYHNPLLYSNIQDKDKKRIYR